MAYLDKLFEDLVAVSRGDVETLARATRQFAREVTEPTTLMPRDTAPPAPQPTKEPSQTGQSAA
jgi:hypothetical protein